MAEVGNIRGTERSLRCDELGAVLESLGPSGDASARLEAVIALLVGDPEQVNRAIGGAFAGELPKVTGVFTSGLHNCLTGPPVNNGSEVECTPGRLRKQC